MGLIGCIIDYSGMEQTASQILDKLAKIHK